MANVNERLGYYLGLARAGQVDAAFDHLVGILDELESPLLENLYRSEFDPLIRALLVKLVWNLRSPSAVPFLAEALQDPDPAVWREALDGLVALASHESLAILQGARDEFGEDRPNFREWVEQAIEDATGRINE